MSIADSLIAGGYPPVAHIHTDIFFPNRLRGEGIAYGPWRLGRWGLPINLFSIVYSIFISIFLFFPIALPVTAANFNWTVVVFFGVVFIAQGYWFTFGRKQFSGPVKEMMD